jgi:hypothetical protein
MLPKVESASKETSGKSCCDNDAGTLDFTGFQWCRWPDSNRQGMLSQQILSLLCLPFHHSGVNFGISEISD